MRNEHTCKTRDNAFVVQNAKRNYVSEHKALTNLLAIFFFLLTENKGSSADKTMLYVVHKIEMIMTVLKQRVRVIFDML